MNLFSQSVEHDLFASDFGESFSNTFQLQDRLYQGSQSEIFLVINPTTHQRFTLKAIRKQTNLVLNLKNLEDICHPQIASLVTWGETSTYYYVVKPFIEGVSLKQHIESMGPFQPETLMPIALQIIRIFEYLQSLNPPIIYRDLKPDNLIITPEGNVVLIDLISIRQLNQMQHHDTFYVGTKGFAAPEQYGFQQTDLRTDIYGMGATLYYLCTGNAPDLKTIQKIKIQTYNTIHQKHLMSIIQKCMHFDPDKRFQSFTALRYALTPKARQKKPHPIYIGLGLLCLALLALPLYSHLNSAPPKPESSIEIPMASPHTAVDIQTNESPIFPDIAHESEASIQNDGGGSDEDESNDSPINDGDLNDTTNDFDSFDSSYDFETIDVSQTPPTQDESVTAWDEAVTLHLIPQIKSGLSTSYSSTAIHFHVLDYGLAYHHRHYTYVAAYTFHSDFTLEHLEAAILDTSVTNHTYQLPTEAGLAVSLPPDRGTHILFLLYDYELNCIGYDYLMNVKTRQFTFETTTVLDAFWPSQVPKHIEDHYGGTYHFDHFDDDRLFIRIAEWDHNLSPDQLSLRFNYLTKELMLKSDGHPDISVSFYIGTLITDDDTMIFYQALVQPLENIIPQIPYRLVAPKDSGWVIPDDLAIIR